MASIGKLFTREYYLGLLKRADNYYHPLMRAGSAKPLFHCMIAVSVIMYSTSYYARDYKRIQHKREIEKEALHEYWEKRGGAPTHH